jgi:type II secretory pathway pseudopilin PulG
LGTALATEAVTAAPVGLAGSVVGAALASAAAGGGITATLAKLMTMTRVKMAIVSALAAAALTTFVVIQHQAQAALQGQDELLRRQAQELARQQAENERLAGLVQAGGSSANTLDELVRIRSEVEALRKQTNSLGLRARNALQPNGSPSILEMREEEKRSGIALLNYTKRWLSAFLKFASQNRDQFPTSFDQARPFLSAGAISNANFTTGQFEILHQGSTSNIAAPARVVLLREKQARRSYDGTWSRAYGFADGHSEMMTTLDGNFEAWEKRQLVWPPPDR